MGMMSGLIPFFRFLLQGVTIPSQHCISIRDKPTKSVPNVPRLLPPLQEFSSSYSAKTTCKLLCWRSLPWYFEFPPFLILVGHTSLLHFCKGHLDSWWLNTDMRLRVVTRAPYEVTCHAADLMVCSTLRVYFQSVRKCKCVICLVIATPFRLVSLLIGL